MLDFIICDVFEDRIWVLVTIVEKIILVPRSCRMVFQSLLHFYFFGICKKNSSFKNYTSIMISFAIRKFQIFFIRYKPNDSFLKGHNLLSTYFNKCKIQLLLNYSVCIFLLVDYSLCRLVDRKVRIRIHKKHGYFWMYLFKISSHVF